MNELAMPHQIVSTGGFVISYGSGVIKIVNRNGAVLPLEETQRVACAVAMLLWTDYENSNSFINGGYYEHERAVTDSRQGS